MTVKSLLVKIGTDIKDMEVAYGKANKLIQKNSEKFKKAGKAIAVAGVAVTAAIGLMVRSYVKAGDEVHKMALRTGFTTKSLSELKYAAEISGATLGDVEKGVKKMAKTILDANDGLATYIRAFDRIGLSAKDLMNLSPEEQFDKIARAISAVESPTIRAAVAQDVFGRAGTKLLPLFAAGEEGLEKLRQKARDMGIVFDQEAANKAAILNDSMTTLKDSFRGVTQKLAEGLVPTITNLVDKISAVAQKVKDWIVEHPKLAGVILKVVGALGILMTVLGPLLIMLPGLAIAFGALTWPIVAVIAVVAALIGIVIQVIKYWEPIKGFFSKLWKSITGFFVNAFNTIKKKMLDWAIGIVGILAKIPFVKKLAGPWKETLQSMRDAMDETSKHVDQGAIKISFSFADMGKKVKSALGGIFKKMTEWHEGAKNAPKIIAKANEKITSLYKTMTDELAQLGESEYETAKRHNLEKLQDRIATIKAEEAGEAQRNEAIALARASFRAEDAALDTAHKQAEIDRENEAHGKKQTILASLYADKKAKMEEFAVAAKAAEDKHLEENAILIDGLKQMTMDRWAYENDLLDRKYKKEKKTSTNLGLLWKKYELDKAALAQEQREAESAARKASLENALADVAMTLGAIRGLFGLLFDYKMQQIDNEERRRFEAIDNLYNAQIEANQALLDEEQKKTEKILQSIRDDYDAKKQYILDNVEDEEERNAQLAALELEREDRLTQARTDREVAEQEMADALQAIEDAKLEAIEVAEVELEGKRKEARIKGAKQEKAVALLSAVVATAAAIVNALKLPFPLNLIHAAVVGAMGAVQIALIASKPIPMAHGALVTGPTEALIGEKGPELVIPLDKLGGVLAGAGGGGEQGSTYLQATFNINALDPSTMRDVVRNQIGPEFIEFVRVGMGKTEMKEALL